MYRAIVSENGLCELWSDDGRLIAKNLQNDAAHALADEFNALLDDLADALIAA